MPGAFAWFDLAWPWIGLAFAVPLAVLLFATNRLRDDMSVSRWRDPRWLAFLAVVAYLVHNVEEYGIAADGTLHAFPDALCTLLGQPAYPDCGIPPAFYLFVNLPLVWVAAPLAALLARRIGLAALAMWGVIAVNAVVHIVPAVGLRAYDPGLFTAVVLFLPLSVVTAVAMFGRRGPYRTRAMFLVAGAGILIHAVLAASALLFLRGALPEWVLLGAQPTVVAVGYLIVALAGRRMRRPAPADQTVD